MKHSMRAVLALAFATLASTALAQSADTILSGGNILTVDEDFTVVEALAIRDGRIVATGQDADMAALTGADTVIIELEGRTVIPGLIDNHLHFIRGAWNNQTEVRLGGIRSRAEALDALAARVEAVDAGTWVTVMGGWMPEQFLDDTTPFTLAELDAISPNTPLYLLRNYSDGYANSAAFEVVDVDSDGSSRLSGRDALTPFTNAVTWRNKSSSAEAILAYMNVLNGLGLTMVYDVGRPSEGELTPLEDLATSQALPLRVFHTLRYSARDEASKNEALELIEGGAVPFSNDLQFGLLGMGEHIYVPVSDSPDHTHDWSEEDWAPFSEISYAAARNGWTVHEHIMSQATAVQYLDLIEEIAIEIPAVKDLRWTFAHVNGMDDDDIARAAALGVAFGVHSQARMSVNVTDAPRIGSIARSGALWGLGSDAGIVAPANPFWTLEWVVSGTDVAGGDGWSEDQRISREDALRAHTIQNATMMFVEDDLGSLEVGKLADLVVLDQDYMAITATEISSISPVLTMTGGEVVFTSEQ